MFSKIRAAAQTAATVKHAAENVTEEIAAVKDHLEEHKEAYLAGASCLTVGLAIGMTVAGKNGGSNIAKQQVIALKTGNVTQNVTQVLVRRGHPGYITRCIETGETFASASRAAQATGVSRASLMRHLNGAAASASGFHFENLGDAASLIH